jgi:hypothetical protein
MAGTVLFAGASETATLTVTFNVTSGGVTTPTDPTTVAVTVRDPYGVSTTYTYPSTVTKSSTGNYACTVNTPLAGEWDYTWTGTGTVPDVQHGSFSVQETNLGHLYATPQQLRSRVGLQATDTSFDLELQQACYAASRSLERYTGRKFWRGAAEARVFRPRDLYCVEFGPYNDVTAVTSVAVDYDGDGAFEQAWVAGTDFELRPENTNSSPEPQPYLELVAIGARVFPVIVAYAGGPTGRLARVQVTAAFGWPSVPQPITEATRILAAQLFRMRDAPLGVASFGDIGVARVRSNPMVAMLAAPYRHAAAMVA